MSEEKVIEKEVIEKVALTDSEAGTLRGLQIAKIHAQSLVEAINSELLACQANEVAKRLGCHPSIFVEINPIEKWITVRRDTLASDAPKKE